MSNEPESRGTPSDASEALAIASSMKPWLYVLGIGFMLLAVPYAATGQGLLLAWVPLWLGVLLILAARAASRGELTHVLRRIKLFVVVLGLAIGLALFVFSTAVLLAGHTPFARWIEWTGF